MLALSILSGKSFSREDSLRLPITSNGLFKVVTPYPHRAFSIDVAQCHLHTGVLRGVMSKCIELQGFFTCTKSDIHLLDSFGIEVFEACNRQFVLEACAHFRR